MLYGVIKTIEANKKGTFAIDQMANNIMKGSPSDEFANWLTSCFNPYGHSKRSHSIYPCYFCPYLAPLSWLLCIYEARDSLLKPLIWPDAKLMGTLTTLVITPYGVAQKKI